jgi:hypothetical protein
MPRADATAESYPRLRDVLGEDGFKELARLIRTTYEANEQRRLRKADEPAPPGGNPPPAPGGTTEVNRRVP